MARRLRTKRLVIASHNPGKVREIGALLAPLGLALSSAGELGLPVPEEDGESFLENAAIKARAAARRAGLPALADDSGLVVEALGGAPGVRSARWAGPGRDFGRAMERLREALAGADPRAEMVCALALGWPDGHVEACEGRVRGALSWPPRGEHGFGFEPIFVPAGERRTYGEMPRHEKERDDPRARAFASLRRACLPAPPA